MIVIYTAQFLYGFSSGLGLQVHGIASLLFFEKHPWSSYICTNMAKRTGRVGSIGLRVRLTRIFHMNFFFYKENNMYLSFGKLCNKLLDVKCIILNSPLILRMNSVKLINTYLIILKLYKF